VRGRPLRLWLICYFLSGATGLVFQVVWMRMLGLVFGHTAYATATVLTAFMAGLGLGSALFGARASRLRDPARTYGLLEVAIGLFAAASPWLIELATVAYLHLHSTLGLSYENLSLVQFALVAFVLMLPATLMGGTLPLMSQAFAESSDESPDRSVGTLYTINTFGAVLGVTAAGFVLLPLVGNRATLWAAAAVNFAVGAVVLRSTGAASRTSLAAPGSAERHLAAANETDSDGAAPVWVLAAALAWSGAVSMLYEVGWTRALSQVIGSSTYVFTAVLAAFLVGIAGGSAIYVRLLQRSGSPLVVFTLLQCGIGLATVAVLAVFDRAPIVFLEVLRRSSSPAVIVAAQFAISVAALLPITLLIGATFPCAATACAPSARRTGAVVGRLYAANTLGSIAGSFLGGFVLIPWIGVHAMLVGGAIANLVLGAVLVFVRTSGVPAASRRTVLVLSAVGAAAAFWLPMWDLRLLSSAPSHYAGAYLADPTSLAERMKSREFVFHRDGPTSTVTVTRSGDALVLRTDGKSEASTEPGETPSQAFLGHLPLLLHGDPARRVLHIGLGGGVSSAAVLLHPVEHLDIVEIEPAVVEAARMFASVNAAVYRDPRSRITVADGRNYLLTTPQRYDVIISQPSHLWVSGVAALFSEEYFRACADHLEADGLMAQWVQTSVLAESDLRTAVATFAGVFPDTTLWRTASGQMLMIGRTAPTPIDLIKLKESFEASPAIAQGIEKMGVVGWGGVLGNFLLGPADVARYTDGSAWNTDDRLPLEFSAARALYRYGSTDLIANLEAFRSAEFPNVTSASRAQLADPVVRRAIGVMLMARGERARALGYLGAVPAPALSPEP
jgi:spermidine synthase